MVSSRNLKLELYYIVSNPNRIIVLSSRWWQWRWLRLRLRLSINNYQWRTGEDRECPGLPPSRRSFICSHHRIRLKMQLQPVTLLIQQLCPLPIPLLQPPPLLHPPSLLRPSKPLPLVVIPLFPSLFPNLPLSLNIRDRRFFCYPHSSFHLALVPSYANAISIIS